MEIGLQLFFIVISLLTFVYVILKIRKHKLNIDDSIIWILWALVLLIMSIFIDIPIWLSKTLGFDSTSNFIVCLFVFFSYIISFFQTIKISELKEKNKNLIHKLSLKEKYNKNK